MGLSSQYRRETNRLYEETFPELDAFNRKHAYIKEIKELLDSIYNDYTKNGRLIWWRVLLNAGTIIARVLAIRELAKKIG